MHSSNRPPSRPKKIWFGSDFHYERLGPNYGLVELKDDILEKPPYDYMMIVGDLNWSRYVSGTLAAIYRRTQVPILYTPGNHEFWDGLKRRINLEDQVEEMREACEKIEGITFLYNEGLDIPETNTSLFMSPWFTNLSDYEDYDENLVLLPQSHIQECIGDYHRTNVDGRLLRASDHIRMNLEAQVALDGWLAAEVAPFGRTPLIGTHFGPSKKSFHAHHPQRDIVASYFNTDYLDRSTDVWPNGTTWVHGHTHWNVDYMHPCGVRVVTNQFGYKGETATNDSYDFLKHIEVY